MRLIYVSHSFPPANKPLSNVGGMQRVATELHSALKAHPGISLRSLILRSTWAWTHVKTPFFLLRSWYQVRRAIVRDEVDVVLFSSMVTASLALPLKRLARAHNVGLATISHGRDVTLPVEAYQRLVPHVFNALDAVFPVSEATAGACQKRGLPPEKSRVVPNGVDLSRFDASPDARRAARGTLLRSNGTSMQALPNDALVLLSVGRQVERKGFAWFIKHVMPRLPEKVHYWLAGDGPEEEDIDDAIEAHGLQHRVQRLGRVTERELDALYHGTDLFVMPNIPVPGDMEGFGIVMLEAGQCGLPTVASRLEGITDVICEEKNGHLVEAENAEAFASVIHRYVDDRNALDAASSKASQYVSDTFSWPAVARQYVEALNEVVHTKQVA